MPVFVWNGRSGGKELSGEIEAASQDEVIAHLRKQKIIISKIKEKGKGMDMEINIQFGSGIGLRDRVIFTRQFSTMIDAGLPMIQCLDILGTQSENRNMSRIVLKIKDDVEGGSTLSEAMQKHPDVFDKLYCNMVNAGEIGGILDIILQRLADYLEAADKLERKVKGAMVYPAVIVVVAIIAIAGMLIFVIPTFQKMFEGQGAKLPGPTLLVIAMSHFLKTKGWIFLFVIPGTIFALKKFYATDYGQHVIDQLLLKMPLFGPLARKSAIAKFSRTLGTLMSSGVNLLDALEITAKTSGNIIIEDALFASRQSVSEGRTLAEPLSKSGVFPPMVCHMVNVGEETGAVDIMLSKIADFYDSEVETAVEGLLSAMEPLFMVVIGGILGFILIAMYMPIFSLGAIAG